VLHGVLNNDSAAIAEAELIADIALTQLYGGTSTSSYPRTTGFNAGWGGGRQTAKSAILVAFLAEATGKAKWAGWRNALIDTYLGAATYTTVITADGTAGFYHADQPWHDVNNMYNGWVGSSAVNYGSGSAAWAAGVRSNSSYQSSHHVYFLWLAYMSTGRSDVRNRLIECARFYKHYAHDAGQTAEGGPFIGAKFGLRLPGDRWHVSNPGAAQYDLIAVNPLVWGYKLTGDVAMLDRAKVHMRNGTRWNELRPPGEGPRVSPTEVYMFLDTHREHFGDSGDKHFAYNKGQLPYCYQILENGGRPTVL
jgi:hypothetical protein